MNGTVLHYFKRKKSMTFFLFVVLVFSLPFSTRCLNAKSISSCDENDLIAFTPFSDERITEPLRTDGDLNSLQTGTFTRSQTTFTYSLNYYGSTPSIYGIASFSSYGMEIKVYYLDSGVNHPLIVNNNVIPCLPVSNARTAYVQITSLNQNKTYGFSISAQQLSNFASDHDFFVYEPSSLSLTAFSFSSTGSNIVIAPTSTIAYDPTDLDSLTSDGVARVLDNCFPYSSIALPAYYRYINNGTASYSASGFRIRPNLFATAAHCLFSTSDWAFSQVLYLYTNLHGTNYDECIAGIKFFIPVGWFIGSSDCSDFGFILCADDTSTERLGFDASYSVSVNDVLWACGYPHYSYSNYHMYWSEGNVYNILGDGRYCADYPYSGGGSGSPVFHDGSVIGIHINGFIDNVSNERVGSGVQPLSQAFQNTYLSIVTDYM